MSSLHTLQEETAQLCRHREPSWELFRETIQPLVFTITDMRYKHTGVIHGDVYTIVNNLKDIGCIDFLDYLMVYRFLKERHLRFELYDIGRDECGGRYCYAPNCRYCCSYSSLFSEKGVLRSKYKRKFSQKIQQLLYSFDYSPEEEILMKRHTIQQLKKSVKANHFPTKSILNKSRKYDWVQAYIETRKWGVNTFALRCRLPDDVVWIVRSYLQE